MCIIHETQIRQFAVVEKLLTVKYSRKVSVTTLFINELQTCVHWLRGEAEGVMCRGGGGKSRCLIPRPPQSNLMKCYREDERTERE